MRVIGGREGVDVDPEGVFALGLPCLLEAVAVTLGQQFLDFGVGLAVEPHAQRRSLQALVPKRVERGFIRRPGRVLAIHFKRLVGAEVERLHAVLQLGQQVFKAVDQPPLMAVEHVEGGAEVAALERVVKLMPMLFHGGHVGGGEVHPCPVQSLKVVVEYLAGGRVVQGLAQVVVVAQLLNNGQAGAPMDVQGCQGGGLFGPSESGAAQAKPSGANRPSGREVDVFDGHAGSC